MWFLRQIWAFVVDFLETLVISLAVFVLVYLFLFQPHQVEGRSMEDTFQNGEYILTDKISYRFREPERGDVIVFHSPQDERVDFIKRIIALPGDRIMIKGSMVYLNGKLLDEPYVKEGISPQDSFLREGVEVSVPSGNYVVMGDNRLHSSDSRKWGFITKQEIVGRAFFRYWPLDALGTIPTSESEPTVGAVQGLLDSR